MIRTIGAVVILFLATFFLPFWVQGILYLLAVLTVRHRVLLLLPAFFADAWYAPVRTFSVHNNKTVLIVIGMILIYVAIVRNTRVTQTYGLPKK